MHMKEIRLIRLHTNLQWASTVLLGLILLCTAVAASFLNYLGRPVLVLLLLLMNGFCLCFVVTRMFDITSDSSKPGAEVVISSFFFFFGKCKIEWDSHMHFVFVVPEANCVARSHFDSIVATHLLLKHTGWLTLFFVWNYLHAETFKRCGAMSQQKLFFATDDFPGC